jgi:hypothetical protein
MGIRAREIRLKFAEHSFELLGHMSNSGKHEGKRDTGNSQWLYPPPLIPGISHRIDLPRLRRRSPTLRPCTSDPIRRKRTSTHFLRRVRSSCFCSVRMMLSDLRSRSRTLDWDASTFPPGFLPPAFLWNLGRGRTQVGHAERTVDSRGLRWKALHSRNHSNRNFDSILFSFALPGAWLRLLQQRLTRHVHSFIVKRLQPSDH